MNDKAITASTLLKDLQRQQLLSTHLRGGGQGNDQRESRRSRFEGVTARVADTTEAKKSPPVCFLFQKGGTCKFGADCRFPTSAKPKTDKKPPGYPKTPKTQV